MRSLYPKLHHLHSLLPAMLALGGCQDQGAAQPQFDETWPNHQEALFQEAEALKYSLQQHRLEQHRLEQQRLRTIGAAENPPAPIR